MHKNSTKQASQEEADLATRRKAVVDIISSKSISSQQELVAQLARRGLHVTQATLSRDLKALGVGKNPDPEHGYVYALGPSSRVSGSRRILELEVFVQDVRVVNNLVLVRTTPGNAQGVGRVLDEFEWSEIEGTISGDDTVLVVTATPARAKALKDRIQHLMSGKA